MFHVVKHSYNDVFQTYSIYFDNKPYLKIAAKKRPLGKREAYAICKLLNTGTVKNWS